MGNSKAISRLRNSNDLDPYDTAFYTQRGWADPSDGMQDEKYAVLIQTMFLLIESDHEIFTTTALVSVGERAATGHFTPQGIHQEDGKRAILFLRHLKLNAKYVPGARAKREGAQPLTRMDVVDDTTMLQGVKLKLPTLQYITDEELAPVAAEEESANILGGLNTKLQMTSTMYSKIFKEMPKIREIQAHNLMSLTEEQYRQSVKEMLGEAFSSSTNKDAIIDNNNDEYEPNFFQDAEFKVRRQMTARGQMVLPPLSRMEQKEVLEFLASNCQILHDAFLEVPQLADTESATAGLTDDQARQLHMATQAACGTLSFAPLDHAGNVKLNVKSDEDEAFWQMQRDMNTVSSNPMTANEALVLLFRDDDVDCHAVKEHEWNVVSPKVSAEARRGGPRLKERTGLFPKAWQVVGVAWLQKMEATMICGGILADGYGTELD